jgi:hypothetical protein
MAGFPLFLLVLAAAGFSAAHANPPRTWVELYDFSATGLFHVARQTELRRVNSGTWIADATGNIRRHRYVMSGSRLDVGFRLEVVNEEEVRIQGLFHELQSFALKEMLQRGYISPSLFDDVSYAMHIWKPGQVRFALDMIELTEAEANRRYDGNIPWHRVMGGKEFHPKTKLNKSTGQTVPAPLTIVRASIMIGTGQLPNLKAGGYYSMPLSWEHYPEPHPLAFNEGSVPPLMAEFSRALAGDNVLGGSLSELIRLSFYWLEAEARLLGGSPDKYLLFAHGLDKAHARYFRQAFRMKQFTKEARQALLENGLDFSALPLGSATDDRSVTFTTLAEATKIPTLNTTGLSLTRSWRSGVCGGEDQQHAFEREFYRGVFWHLIFPDEIQKTPICIQDLSPIAMLPALNEIHGWQREGDFSKLFNRAGNMKWDPNFWAPYWNRGAFIVAEVRAADGIRPLAAVRIDNVVDGGEPYLREVLAQTYAAQWHRLYGANPDSRRVILSYLRQLEATLPPVPGTIQRPLSVEPSPDEILDRIVYMVSTDQPAVRDLALRLGGKAFPGNALRMPHIKVRVEKGGVTVLRNEIAGEGWVVVFRANQIRAMAEQISQPRATCSGHLLNYVLLQLAAQM